MSRRAWSLPPLILGVGLLLPGSAAAHIEIVSHTTRFGPDSQKQGPCGLAGMSEPGGTVYTYAPGATVAIAWNEFVNHPGHYRIAFDEQGDDDFVTPSSASDVYTNEAVLLDDIADLDGVHDYTIEVTLPDIECEQCTIQVIQVMTDKPPFGDGNDVYFHCIDVTLAIGGDPSTGEPNLGDEDEAGCACASEPSPRAGLGLFGLFGLFALRRRSIDREQPVRLAVEPLRPAQ